LVARLRSRFGTEGQSYLYQARLRVRRRGKEETLQALYHDISRMVGLAFPGKSSIHREVAETEAFIEAINDGSLRLRIKDKEPKGLKQALRIALMAEANTAERVSVEAVEIKVKDYKARSAQSVYNVLSASPIEEAVVAGVSVDTKDKDPVDKRCEKICEVMEMLVKNCAIGRNANYVNRIHAMPLLGAAELEGGLHGQTAGDRMTAEESNSHCGEKGCYETAKEEISDQYIGWVPREEVHVMKDRHDDDGGEEVQGIQWVFDRFNNWRRAHARRVPTTGPLCGAGALMPGRCRRLFNIWRRAHAKKVRMTGSTCGAGALMPERCRRLFNIWWRAHARKVPMTGSICDAGALMPGRCRRRFDIRGRAHAKKVRVTGAACGAGALMPGRCRRLFDIWWRAHAKKVPMTGSICDVGALMPGRCRLLFDIWWRAHAWKYADFKEHNYTGSWNCTLH